MKSKSDKMQEKIAALFVLKRNQMLSQRLLAMEISLPMKHAIAGDEHYLRNDLKAGFDPDHRDAASGRTLLHESCANGHYHLVRMLLLEYSVDTNIVTVLGRSTALHLAVEKGFRQIASLLLGHGADYHAADEQGCTPLHLARRFNIVKMLFKSVAVDPTLRNHRGMTPREQYLADTPMAEQDASMAEFMRIKEDERMLENTRLKLQSMRSAKSERLRLEAMAISANTTTVKPPPKPRIKG